MHLIVVGLNHKTAPIEIREKISFTEGRLDSSLKALSARPECDETVILSTCNRTEIYATVPHPAHTQAIVSFLSEYHHVPVTDFQSHLYTLQDMEAVDHLFRVASGIDSLVLGEAQILRQVRDAFASATDSNTIGTVLNGLLRAAIVTGRRSRTETEIGKGGFSVGHAAVDLSRSIFGSLEGASVLILGAGKMSELTAKHLVASGVKVVLVANRTHERAVALAARLGGKAIRYDEFPDAMVSADIVISSTAAPVHIIDKQTLLPILKRRRGRPLFLIDIAVPRDIHAEVSSLENVFLYDVDDLEEVVADQAKERKSEVERVEALIQEECQKFANWWRSLNAAPVITQIRSKHEEIRQAELSRLRNQLPDLSDRAWQCIEAATRSMLTKISRDPIEKLKDSTGNEKNQNYDLLTAAMEIFALDETKCIRPVTDNRSMPEIPEEDLEI